MPLMKGGDPPTRVDERLGFLFAVARDPMLIVESADTLSSSTIVDCNQKALELFGYRRDTLLGKPLSLVELEPGDQPPGPDGKHGDEALHRRSDGQVIVIERNFATIESHGRDLLLVSLHDVTTARLLEKAILRVQQMDNVGVVSGTLVHDFRNLLVGILANAELALAGPGEGPGIRERIVDILHSARRATDIVDRVLPSGGGLEQRLHQLDLNEIVEDSVALMRPSLHSEIALEVDPARGRLAVRGDHTQLRQVVMNLVINAAEAIGATPGTIGITTGKVDASRADFSTALPPVSDPTGTWLYLDVSDSGPGIDATTRERIFEPLFTTKSSGTGLGLTAVLFAVRRHNGAITLRSGHGNGATFRVLFPASTS